MKQLQKSSGVLKASRISDLNRCQLAPHRCSTVNRCLCLKARLIYVVVLNYQYPTEK